MSNTAYDRITTACLLIVVLSALAYESAAEYQFLILLSGVLAAFFSVCLYFYYHWTSSERTEATQVMEASFEHEDTLDAQFALYFRTTNPSPSPLMPDLITCLREHTSLEHEMRMWLENHYQSNRHKHVKCRTKRLDIHKYPDEIEPNRVKLVA